MTKPWDIPIGSLVKPNPNGPNATEHLVEDSNYQLGVVIDRAEYAEDDLAGPICYQVWWNGEVEWWMPDELIVVTE